MAFKQEYHRGKQREQTHAEKYLNIELDEKINSTKIGSNYSRNSTDLPPDITMKREHDEQIFYDGDDITYVMSYMIYDLNDSHAIQLCDNLGIHTLQHLSEL